jgi:hypothetical protein
VLYVDWCIDAPSVRIGVLIRLIFRLGAFTIHRRGRLCRCYKCLFLFVPRSTMWRKDNPNTICFNDVSMWARSEPFLGTFPSWGEDLAKLVEPSADKFVHFVICKVGGEGKTQFGDWMMCHKKAMHLDHSSQVRSVLKSAGGIQPYHTYIIDLTCAETVKIAESKSRCTRFYDEVFRLFERDRSGIVVFWRRDPDPGLLARANCKFWTVTDDVLRPYEAAPLPVPVETDWERICVEAPSAKDAARQLGLLGPGAKRCKRVGRSLADCDWQGGDAWDVVRDAPTITEALKTLGARPQSIKDIEIVREESTRWKYVVPSDVDVSRFKPFPEYLKKGKRAIVLRGPPGIGKTQWALSLFQRPYLVQEEEDLNRIPGNCDGIVFENLYLGDVRSTTHSHPPKTLLEPHDCWFTFRPRKGRVIKGCMPGDVIRIFTCRTGQHPFEGPHHEFIAHKYVLVDCEDEPFCGRMYV